MPVQTRPSDQFTRGNLLIGFSVVEFQPKLLGGGYGAAIQLGILSGQTLDKTVDTLKLERGDSGTLSLDREIVSKFEAKLGLECFNFRSDLAQYLLGSSSITPVTANAAQAVTGETVRLPVTNTYDAFIETAFSPIAEASMAVTCAPLTAEAVGTGNAVLGGTQGDFSLKYKIKAIADVASVTITTTGGVATVYTVGGPNFLVAGSAAPTANQVMIEIGKEDSRITGSGAMIFGASVIPPLGATIVATYTPSFSGADFVTLVDFMVDPVLGRIRFLDKAAGDNQPFRTPGTAALEQPLNLAYTYNRRASNTLKPFTQNQFEGKATVRHLTDVGVNFIWQVPSATILMTGDALKFGADNFATGTMQMNINDAGGSDRFGTLAWSSEAESV